MLLALKRHQAQELIRKQQQGHGRPIISGQIAGHQVVAAGNTVYFSKKWKFFADFLADYIQAVLGHDWIKSELQKPLEDRHQILKWWDRYLAFQRQHQPRTDGNFVASPTGIVFCYLGLAYSLYLLKHNVELQDRLVARLKTTEQFQGAYYELMVANCLIRAGFVLELEDEADTRSKHCEFSAVSKHTSKKYWVEAKMRSVSGILGKTAADGASPKAKPTSRLSEHIREALKKPAHDERLIFVDVNAPPLEHCDAGKVSAVPVWIEAAERQLANKEKELRDNERAYVFVTNMSFHRSLDDTIPGHAAFAYGLGIPDFFTKGGPVRLRDAWRRKQKHIDAVNIMETIRTYPKIPTTFDGGLPLSPSVVENMVLIGETYFFEDGNGGGILGRVTSADMMVDEKKVYIGIATETGEGRIFTRDVTDEELSAYKEHPDAFFGVIKKATRNPKGPFELFEWLVDNYIDTPKERLLELCKGRPDIEALSKFDRLDLVLELCESYAASVLSQARSKTSAPSAKTPPPEPMPT